jgi:hypothetical protein
MDASGGQRTSRLVVAQLVARVVATMLLVLVLLVMFRIPENMPWAIARLASFVAVGWGMAWFAARSVRTVWFIGYSALAAFEAVYLAAAALA